MSDERINKRVFLWANRQKRPNWCSCVKGFLKDQGLLHLCDIEQEPLQTKSVMRQVEDAMQVYHNDLWQSKLRREEAQNGQGRNKLRTYRMFKKKPCMEPYLVKVYSKKYRSAMSKFRCGVAPLKIETGRYNGTPLEDRVCFNCPSQIESEQHVLISCNVYNDIRTTLFQYANAVCNQFNDMNETDKMCFLLSDQDMCTEVAKTLYMILTRRREILYNR